MALNLAQVQAISNYLHYALMNYSLNNDEKRNNLIRVMNVIDAELALLGGTKELNPKRPG